MSLLCEILFSKSRHSGSCVLCLVVTGKKKDKKNEKLFVNPSLGCVSLSILRVTLLVVVGRSVGRISFGRYFLIGRLFFRYVRRFDSLLFCVAFCVAAANKSGILLRRIRLDSVSCFFVCFLPWYRSVSKCRDNLYINTEYNRSLYIGTELYIIQQFQPTKKMIAVGKKM